MKAKEIYYFDEGGPSNTDHILRLAKRRLEELGIRRVVISTARGFTLRRFLEIARPEKYDVVAMTQAGHGIPASWLFDHLEGSRKMKEEHLRQGLKYVKGSDWDEKTRAEKGAIQDEETQRELEKEGVKICFLPSGPNIGEPRGLTAEQMQLRSLLQPFLIPSAADIRPSDIAVGMDLSILSIISQGFRVCVVAAVVAVKAGLIPEGETIVSIAGTGFAGGGADTAIVIQAGSSPKTCSVREILGFPILK
jgi:hypothetical protein